MKPEKRFVEEFVNRWNRFLERSSADEIKSSSDWQ
jgi:hypothetical protein